MPDCELCATRSGDHEWSVRDYSRVRKALGITDDWDNKQLDRILQDNWDMPITVTGVCEVAEAEKSVQERFLHLAADWSENTGHVSSISDLTSHPSYQEIIRLGWDVVPFLLIDLRQNKRFWFPALHAITKVRPFDPGDAGNGRRMTDAWIKWGKRKGLI